jgi:hypothetical protein
MSTFNYPDFDNAVPDVPRRSFLRDGYAEQRLLDAMDDLIADCGGNRLIAQGIAVEIVKERTEKRR